MRSSVWSADGCSSELIGVRKHVVHTRGRKLAEPGEVGGPDVVRAAAAVPNVVLGVVERAVSQEVDRADYVIPITGVQQVTHLLLATGNEANGRASRRERGWQDE